MSNEEYEIDAARFAQTLREQRWMQLKGGLYHLTRIQMAYNTNRIEGSRLSEQQTRYLYESRTITGDALVDEAIAHLLAKTPDRLSFAEICDFHVEFETIYPFQDGNGRVGRLVMFEQCLANDIMPFIVLDDDKAFYYRGLDQYDETPGFLTETFRKAQDDYYSRYSKFVPRRG